MHVIFVLILLCAAPTAGAFLGMRIMREGWISSRWRLFLASLPFAGACVWLVMTEPWYAVALALFGFVLLREARAYPLESSSYGGYFEGPHGYRPRVSDGATWGDVHHRDRNVIPWSQKSDLREMQEGAMGSIGSVFGKRFDRHPPVIRRSRPAYIRLEVDNGNFPPGGSTPKKGRLKSVK